MSNIELPDYAVSLDYIQWMFKQLDLRYGKPEIEEPKNNGQKTIRIIFKHLAYHKQSTCEEIAKIEYEKNIQTPRKLKSITDDFRKFIKNNLLWTKLVSIDGSKKLYNKQVTAYSLTPVGILYAIHLFGNLRLDEEIRVIQDESDDVNLGFIKSLAKEYSDLLPKVFGRFDVLERIIGPKFEISVVNSFTRLFSEPEPGIPDTSIMLSEYAMYSYWSKDLTRNGPNPLIAEQISLLFYANLESSIEDILHSRDFEEWTKDIHDDNAKKYEKKSWKEIHFLAKEMWMQILDEDKKLKKWYYDFVRMAVRSKGAEFANLNEYRKEIYPKKR